ncbi:prepilin-type N-terminal cleavage/methylation domain-containing protein [Brevundimonas sp. PAMC22021]|uniref:prepilin-type N-terminal cleavage/methylation domain-containing protein n=1 Tax=Brevundimonas sp. PAMC22021 TaxID=2861285 RepID=UPI001C635F66|nr:prepilin-type N-terminal cleavage/methylation domain-containing protein [Brevundimonas sp. PAMC22021]QYF86433.1 prepilin-type N-terminal cleavage/methylation domain-containing protein [Brevundimonas sp. PAMC22021]
MRRAREGFSLIEALIALAIAAMTLTAIFELQQQMIRGQRRAADAMEQVAAQENALALTRDLNPLEQPEGTLELPEGDTIRWSSEPQTELRTNAGFPTGDGLFQVQLFTVTVEIDRRNGRSPAPLVFDRMGWRRMTGEDG